MSEGHVVGCRLHDEVGAAGRPVLRRGDRHAVIDIHCHLAIPAADAMTAIPRPIN